MKDQVIELGLKGGSGSPLVDSLRDAAELALRFLAEALPALDIPDTDLGERLAKCRAEVARQQDAQAIALITRECAAACQSVLSKIETEKAGKRREIGALIDLVREALTQISGDASAFDASLGQSMDRFEAIGQIDNLQDMQARLATEVKTLRQVATARRTAWDSRFASFGQRIATLEEQLRATQHEATTDALTQVANRARFDKTCREWTSGAHLQFVLALVRLEDLTEMNNEFGIPAGDRILMTVAQVLKALPLNDDDVVARLGGADFAILAGNVTLAQMEARLRQVITRLVQGIEAAGGVRIKPAFSCGLTDSAAGDTSKSLLERAGQALVEASKSGRNRIVEKTKPLMRDLMRAKG